MDFSSRFQRRRARRVRRGRFAAARQARDSDRAGGETIASHCQNGSRLRRPPSRPRVPRTGTRCGRCRPNMFSLCQAQKNDDRDAEGIAEAATRPTMRFVELKSQELLDMQTLHRSRDRLVGERTALINQLRAALLERGLVAPESESSSVSWLR